MTDKQIPDRYHEVGSGWHGILTAMHIELLRICEDYTSLQVKEKFGGLRAYISIPCNEGIAKSREAHAIEYRYEALSLRICETCGQLGENRPVRGYYMTLCAFHREEAEKAVH